MMTGEVVRGCCLLLERWGQAIGADATDLDGASLVSAEHDAAAGRIV